VVDEAVLSNVHKKKKILKSPAFKKMEGRRDGGKSIAMVWDRLNMPFRVKKNVFPFSAQYSTIIMPLLLQ
jgi:hypothetical protein